MPENTLPAFAHALALGITTLELDCAITRDGIVVVSHDARLNPDITRDSAGQWLVQGGPPIWQIPYEELHRYDVGRIRPGSRYAARFPAQRPVDGTRVPRLADLFDLVRRARNDEVRFNIETKLSPEHPKDSADPNTFVRALLAVIRTAGMEQRVTIQSFDWRTLRIVQALAPGIPTVYLSAQQDFMDNIRAHHGPSPWTAGFDVRDYDGSVPRMVRAAGGAVWSPYYGETSRAAVAEAQQVGLKVVVWTVNDDAEFKRMIDLGVDGIISDYPGRLRAAAARAGLPLPRPTPLR